MVGCINTIQKWSFSANIYVGTKTHITRLQLDRIHKIFYHLIVKKLLNVIRKGRPNDATPETLKGLQEISKHCNPCQRILIYRIDSVLRSGPNM